MTNEYSPVVRSQTRSKLSVMKMPPIRRYLTSPSIRWNCTSLTKIHRYVSNCRHLSSQPRCRFWMATAPAQPIWDFWSKPTRFPSVLSCLSVQHGWVADEAADEPAVYLTRQKMRTYMSNIRKRFILLLSIFSPLQHACGLICLLFPPVVQ